jgi:hypothetical protein
MATMNDIYGWTLDQCNEELGAAGHYSLHNDVIEAREAVVAMARELGVIPKKEIRIAKRFGQYVVEGKDGSEWVAIEPGQCSFGDRDDAQDYVDGWLSNSGDMVQVSDFEWFC